MAETKAARTKQRQLGQFMTPPGLAERVVDQLALSAKSRILEPSFGDGAFLVPIVRRFLSLRSGTHSERLAKVLNENLAGIEIDPELAEVAMRKLEDEFGPLPESHGLVIADFFATEFMRGSFEFVVGNPPFGGTFDPNLEDRLDRLYGTWGGVKLKKETYSFFIARALDWLAHDGELAFITSDSCMTIKTMAGLRRRLMDETTVTIETLPEFSAETTQPTLVLHAKRSGRSEIVSIDGRELNRETIELTGNFSWGVDESTAPYFKGPTIGEYMVATSGMTIGKNELFLREIRAGAVDERYDFEFYDEPVTVDKELENARLHRLAPKVMARTVELQATGATVRSVRASPLSAPRRVELPHPDYQYYNKATSRIVYAEPEWAVFWRDEGDAVLTFKRTGKWYLRGVGGQKYFGREGLTWQLVAGKLNARYLPAGYILDSGAPAAFLRDSIPREELWFILGWALTTEATRILKTAINHTRNIQSKDFERMPYPFWVDADLKVEAVTLVEDMVREAQAGRTFDRDDAELQKLEGIYALPR